MAEYNTPVTAHAFRIGAIIALVTIILMVLTYVLDATNTPAVGYLNWLVILAGLAWAGYAFRRDKLDGYISYNKSFTVIFQTGLFYGLIMMVYTAIHYSLVDPAALNEMTRYALEQNLEARPDMTQEQLNMSRSFMENYIYTWWGMALSQLLNGVLWAVIGGLIISLVLKKEHPNPSPFK